MLVSFYDWLMEEGFRKDNPARQTRRPKPRKPQIYRLTRDEVTAFLLAAQTQRERWTAYLGICAGLRREELRLLQGRHFARDGWIWVSADIAKGSRERHVPIIMDLRPVVGEILERVDPDHFVFPATYTIDPPKNTRLGEVPTEPCDGKTLWRTVKRVAKRAGITADVGTHTMRHAFADHIARLADLQSAQSMLGHADLGTTQGYLGKPTLDDRAEAGAHVRFLPPEGYPPEDSPEYRLWRRWESNPRSEPSISQSRIREFGLVLKGMRERLGEAVA
jgi:integrase/recombinase XerD